MSSQPSIVDDVHRSKSTSGLSTLCWSGARGGSGCQL